MIPNETFELRKFLVPEFIFGEGALRFAGQYAMNFHARHVFIVTDAGVQSAGWVDAVETELKKVGLSYTVFQGLTANPKDYEVMQGAECYAQDNCDVILAVGGGSVMDCAKGIGIVSTNHQHILEFEGADEIRVPGPPLICIPTTAGSAAEVSQFAIITNSVEKVKAALISKTLVPDIALVDPLTTATLPHGYAAASGIDALVHAMEAYVSNAGSPFTDLHAMEAIRLVYYNLIDALEHPDDIQYRGKVMLGSLMAGLAFSNASLGLVHSMAHSVGGWADLSHGDCNGILLEHVVRYNYRYARERYRTIGKTIGVDMNASSVDEEADRLVRAISTLRKQIGIPSGLAACSIKKEDLHRLAQNALLDPCIATNPVQPPVEDVEAIYEQAL